MSGLQIGTIFTAIKNMNICYSNPFRLMRSILHLKRQQFVRTSFQSSGTKAQKFLED